MDDLSLESAKLRHIRKVLEMDLGSQEKTAAALGISVRTLRYRIKELGYKTDDEEKEEMEIEKLVNGVFPSSEERLTYLDTGKRRY